MDPPAGGVSELTYKTIVRRNGVYAKVSKYVMAQRPFRVSDCFAKIKH